MDTVQSASGDQPVSVPSGSTITIDPRLGPWFTVTLANPLSGITVTNPVANSTRFKLELCEPSSGSPQAVTWPGNFIGGSPITLTLGVCTSQWWRYDGTNYIAQGAGLSSSGDYQGGGNILYTHLNSLAPGRTSPTIAPGSAAGSGATAIFQGNTSDANVQVFLTTGTGTGSGVLATITFGASYNFPKCWITPIDVNTPGAANKIYLLPQASSTATTVSINATGSIGDSTTFHWQLGCGQ